jgi:hypothetical protein
VWNVQAARVDNLTHINQSINQPKHQSTKASINQRINQPKHSTNASIAMLAV